MRRWLAMAAFLALAPALAAPADPTPPREETAPPVERAGETDAGENVFPPMRVPERATGFPDPVVADIAAKIASGHADLRERRAWYMINLLYAPFDHLPPAGWRANAIRQGEAISVESRRREAAAAAALGSTLGIKSVAPPETAPLATYAWSSLGPTNYNSSSGDLVQGRATALYVNPVNLSMLFAGFAGGGLWKTSNSGSTWTPLTDNEVTTSVGAIDVVPGSDQLQLTDATIYVGLGEGNTSADTIDGAGVLKSTNGGTTWTLQTIPWAGPDAAVNARWRHSIRRILVDRNVAGAQSVWAAGDGGVYHTTDGGTTWTLVTALPYTGKPGVGGCWPELATDFVVDTTGTPTRLYTAFGARSSGSTVAALSCTGIPNDESYRKNNGIYRSLDGGTTWTSITGAGTSFPAVPGNVGRITLMQAPSAKKQIYALIECVDSSTAGACPSGQGSSLGIYRTSDASLTPAAWVLASTTNFCASQGWYDLAGAVDPTNPAKLLVAGLDVYQSTSSGGTLTKKSAWTGAGTGFVHADQHFIAYPTASTVFVACDGGVFKGAISGTGGTTITWSNMNGGGLSTLQFYGIGQHPTSPARIHGGLQDNGEAYTATGSSWSETNGGDGGFSATDWSNGENAYEEYVYGAIARSTTGGASGWTCIQNFGGCSGCGGCVPDGQTSFIAPVVLDANAPSTLYTGSKFVYRNSSAPTGQTWSTISPDLVGTSYDTIINIHSASNNGVAGTIWVATSNGRVQVTTDNGANWTRVDIPPLPQNPVLPTRAATWVATNPGDGRQAIVAFSGWNGNGSQPGHVFRTLDGGSSWDDISGALPDEPVFTIAVDPAHPNDVYIGTEYGVYVNNAGWTGSTWTKINSGQLPNVHVHQLEFSRANGKLRAATHGRGIWELTVSCPAYTPPALDPPAVNQCGVQLSWTPSGSSGTTFNVYRATGDCPATGYVAIASGLTGASFADTAVSGGKTYSYKVTTAESSGGCESTASTCRSVAIPGSCPCLDSPIFGGVTGVSQPFNGACSLTVQWNAGQAQCGSASLVYDIYRGTSPDLYAVPSSRVASCVTGTSFTDTGGLSPGTTYYYLVQAEDGAGPGPGECRQGSVDGNLVRKGAPPLGALAPAPFADGAEGAPSMTMGSPLWSQSSTRANSGAKSYFGDGSWASTCASLTTPYLVPGPAGSPSTLSFYSWRDNLESTYDGGDVEITTDNGASWTKLQLTPTYPATFGSDSSSCANNPQTPASGGFTGNDVAWQGPYTSDLTAYAGLGSRIRFQLGNDPAVSSIGWYVDDISITNTSQPTSCSAVTTRPPEVSSVANGVPLLLSKLPSGEVLLSYEDIPNVGGYDIYEGTVGVWYSHANFHNDLCGAATVPNGGRRETTTLPDPGNRYFLVSAYTWAEGPTGFATAGEIAPGDSTCSP